MKLVQTLARKYQSELKYLRDGKKNFRKEWLELLLDLTDVSEEQWDLVSIRYDAVLNKKKWQELRYHPQRKPYQTKVKSLPKSYKEKYPFIKQVLKDSYTYWNKLRKSDYKDQLGRSARYLLDCAINARYDTEPMRLADTLAGRTEEERDDGKVDPTDYILNRVDYAIKEYARFNNEDYTKLKKKYDKLTGGRPGLITDYFYTCDIPDDLRDEMLKILGILSRDETLDFMAIKIAWEIWKDIREIGLDIDSYLKFYDYPDHQKTIQGLEKFLFDKELTKEMLKHMEDEAPQTYSRYKKTGVIYSSDLIAEEARRKKRPKRLRSEKELKEMIKKAEEILYDYLPLAKKRSPRNVILNPTHPASATRALQSTTKNSSGESIIVIYMTPRINLLDEYLPTLAHESIHAVFNTLIEMAEKSSVLPEGTQKRVAQSVQEVYTQIVQDYFYSKVKLPYKKKYHGKEFPNLFSAWVTRSQAPFSRSQILLRKKFDELWDKGERGDLKEEFLWRTKWELGEKEKDWRERGLKVSSKDSGYSYRVSPPSPDDGLRYIRSFIVRKDQSKSTSKANAKPKEMSIKAAIQKRFGKEWMESKDARTILLWLFIESAKLGTTDGLGDVVLKVDVTDCLATLKKVGVKDKDI
ncbi:hypothetical protein JW710_00765 [Candidatus Dojkabacteria bacterium]|nr:hypothetical protein [Candidatus Dojkabacteria bacterium]